MAVFSLYQLTDEPAQEMGGTEEDLVKTLEQIAGVGQVAVYFHSEQNSESTFNSYFQMEEGSGISGVLIVAEGATSPRLIELLQNSVSQILQLPKHRVVIVPMEMKEEDK